VLMTSRALSVVQDCLLRVWGCPTNEG
jgi:hypothetical protein